MKKNIVYSLTGILIWVLLMFTVFNKVFAGIVITLGMGILIGCLIRHIRDDW